MLNLEKLRALKGSPLSIIIAMFIANQPVGENWLCSVTGYSQNTVRRGCKFLEETQMIRRNGRYESYVLSDGMMQLPLGMKAMPESHSPEGCSSSKSGQRPKLTLDDLLTTTTFNKYEEDFSEEKATVVIPGESKNDARLETQAAGASFFDARLELLHNAGVMEPTASRLLEHAWVTKGYLEAHIEKAKREKADTALLIHRIQSHDPMPRIRRNDPENYRKSWLGKD